MSDKPKKQRKKRAPKAELEAPVMDKAEQKAIVDLINTALSENSEEARKIMSIAQQKDAIMGTMSEFMRNFTLVGFNLDNQAIVISMAMTALDSEALTSLTRKVYAAHLKANG